MRDGRRKKRGPEKAKIPRVEFDLKAIGEIKKRKRILTDGKGGELNGSLRRTERRDTPMNETARSTLEDLERIREFVFPNRNGKRIDDAQIQVAFQEVVRRAGIEDFHFPRQQKATAFGRG
jgi:integrase